MSWDLKGKEISGYCSLVIFREVFFEMCIRDSRIGIDHFKEINDNFGQEYGDFVLKKTAECISGCTSEGQKVYKLCLLYTS